jgi:hypothetical protein
VLRAGGVKIRHGFDLRSLHDLLRCPETMRINHEETKEAKKRPEKTFVLFVSSWLIL